MNLRSMTRMLGGLALVLAVAAVATPAFAQSTPAGTVISNQASVSYQDTTGNTLTALSNIVTTTVAQVASLTVTPDNTDSGNPGDTLYYAHQVQNTGNDTDTIDLTAVSSLGWTTAIYEDVNGNGAYDAGIDTPATDTGALAPLGTFDIIVAVTIPAGTPGATVDTTTVTGTSTNDNTVSDSATDQSTVISPAINVVKSVAPVGDQPPGTVLTYTIVIDNSGNAVATNVVMTDPIPGFTTYQAGTITQDAAARTDAGGDDNADYNVTTGGAITVDVGNLAVGASTTITFQVQID